MKIKRITALAATVALCVSMMTACGSKPKTFEEYCDKHTDTLSQITPDSMESSVKDNEITMTSSLNKDAAEITEEALDQVSEASATDETMPSMVKQVEDASGISGITIVLDFTTNEGDVAYEVVYDKDGMVEDSMPLFDGNTDEASSTASE